jgi:hypothetical protein
VVRYVDYDPKKKCTDAAGRIDYCSPKVFSPRADVLLHNAGDGTFTDVTARSGIARGVGAGLGVAVLDADADGRPDLFVANDGYANHLWRNRGDGTFHDIALLSGTAYNLHGAPEAGMGVVAADLDNDLRPDLFLTHLADETNTFYRNLGDKDFEDRSGPSGLAGSSLPYTGFGTAAFDVELDGDFDLVVANGRVTRGKVRSAAGVVAPWNAFAEPNVLYLNDGEGVFKGAPEHGRAFATPVEISRAVAVGDIDSDGDLDVVVANVESAVRIYRNQATRAGRWLTIRAVDPRYGRDALGAEVTVVGKDWRRVGWVSPGSGYLSSHDPRVHFGLGKVASVERVEIRWPDGMTESFAVPGLDRHLTLARGASENGL